MSAAAIQAALETRLNALTPALATGWENVNFVPPVNANYQVVAVLFAEPENPTLGTGFYRQRGYLQVALHYQQNNGKGDALARAELLRSWFPRGLSMVASGVTTTVDKTPEIGNGQIEGDAFVVRIKVRFFANVGS